MNGISLKELRWFSTFNDEFLESESVSIWQAVLFILAYFDDDASVNYFEDIQRMEISVCEDLIERLNNKGQPLLKNDASPNYERSYSEWDAIANRLLTEEQINEFLPELNRSRLLVIEQIEEADNIYQQLKLEIRKSRGNRPTKILLCEDTLRDDFERVLIERTSLFAVFPDLLPCKKEKPVYWHNITINIDYREKKSITKGDTSGELTPYIVFKAGQKILCQGTPKELSFQGQKKTKPNRSFEILEGFGVHLHKRTHKHHPDGYSKAITILRKLLIEVTEIDEDPFYIKQENNPYEPKFTVKILKSTITDDCLDNTERHTGKLVSYEDGVTGSTQNFDNEYSFTGNISDCDDEENNY